MTDDQRIAAVEDALDGLSALEAELDAVMNHARAELGDEAALRILSEVCGVNKP